MDKPVIEVSDLSKHCRLGVLGAKTFQREIENFFDKLFKRKRTVPKKKRRMRMKQEEDKERMLGDAFLALSDVSFSVDTGDIVGVIGRNGAGKSTLLKIISRITEPTSGEIKLRGRVGSLLEVGTGFHAELTGRENIFLNGAILGMRRTEIAEKFDQIVEFAEVEDFVDTPVKRYSSGMYVRLAFAVAAHLEPEILLIDEVLAVGDVNFQQKCLGKLQEVSGEGRTVLFVSHNLTLINRYCKRVLVMNGGKLIMDTRNIGEAVDVYSELNRSKFEPVYSEDVDILRYEVIPKKENYRTDEAIRVEVEYRLHKPVQGLIVGINLVSREVGKILYSAESDCVDQIRNADSGTYISRVEIPPNLLTTGFYDIYLHMGSHNKKLFTNMEFVESINCINIGGVGSNYINNTLNGIIRPALKWETVEC